MNDNYYIMENKLRQINNNKIIKILSVVCILYINILFISFFAQYFFLNMSLDTPLIAKEQIIKLFNPYAEFGFKLSFAFPIILILKFINQFFFSTLISLVFIAMYYIKLW